MKRNGVRLLLGAYLSLGVMIGPARAQSHGSPVETRESHDSCVQGPNTFEQLAIADALTKLQAVKGLDEASFQKKVDEVAAELEPKLSDGAKAAFLRIVESAEMENINEEGKKLVAKEHPLAKNFARAQRATEQAMKNLHAILEKYQNGVSTYEAVFHRGNRRIKDARDQLAAANDMVIRVVGKLLDEEGLSEEAKDKLRDYLSAVTRAATSASFESHKVYDKRDEIERGEIMGAVLIAGAAAATVLTAGAAAPLMGAVGGGLGLTATTVTMGTMALKVGGVVYSSTVGIELYREFKKNQLDNRGQITCPMGLRLVKSAAGIHSAALKAGLTAGTLVCGGGMLLTRLGVTGVALAKTAASPGGQKLAAILGTQMLMGNTQTEMLADRAADLEHAAANQATDPEVARRHEEQARRFEEQAVDAHVNGAVAAGGLVLGVLPAPRRAPATPDTPEVPPPAAASLPEPEVPAPTAPKAPSTKAPPPKAPKSGAPPAPPRPPRPKRPAPGITELQGNRVAEIDAVIGEISFADRVRLMRSAVDSDATHASGRKLSDLINEASLKLQRSDPSNNGLYLEHLGISYFQHAKKGTSPDILLEFRRALETALKREGLNDEAIATLIGDGPSGLPVSPPTSARSSNSDPALPRRRPVVEAPDNLTELQTTANESLDRLAGRVRHASPARANGITRESFASPDAMVAEGRALFAKMGRGEARVEELNAFMRRLSQSFDRRLLEGDGIYRNMVRELQKTFDGYARRRHPLDLPRSDPLHAALTPDRIPETPPEIGATGYQHTVRGHFMETYTHGSIAFQREQGRVAQRALQSLKDFLSKKKVGQTFADYLEANPVAGIKDFDDLNRVLRETDAPVQNLRIDGGRGSKVLRYDEVWAGNADAPRGRVERAIGLVGPNATQKVDDAIEPLFQHLGRDPPTELSPEEFFRRATLPERLTGKKDGSTLFPENIRPQEVFDSMDDFWKKIRNEKAGEGTVLYQQRVKIGGKDYTLEIRVCRKPRCFMNDGGESRFVKEGEIVSIYPLCGPDLVAYNSAGVRIPSPPCVN